MSLSIPVCRVPGACCLIFPNTSQAFRMAALLPKPMSGYTTALYMCVISLILLFFSFFLGIILIKQGRT
jgi:hypothetical protein